MQIELRDYDIRPGHMGDWIRGWQTGVVPLREQCGFRISDAWVDEEHDRFLWILEYDGPQDFDSADAVYHDLPARRALDPEPSSFVERGRFTRLARVDPGPATGQ